MNSKVKTLIEFAAIGCGVFLIVHRRVIAACLTGEPMPEMPEWHKKCFGCLKGEKEV